MKLANFLESKGISQAKFADLIGVEQAAISRYITGTRMPRKEHLARIRTVTGGAVTADDFVLAEAAE